MASIKIHQNIYGFARKYKGFTARQLLAIVAAVIVFAAIVAVLWRVLALPYQAVSIIAFFVALPLLLAGFASFGRMPAEEFAQRLVSARTSPAAYVPCGEDVLLTLATERSKEYARKVKKTKQAIECGR